MITDGIGCLAKATLPKDGCSNTSLPPADWRLSARPQEKPPMGLPPGVLSDFRCPNFLDVVVHKELIRMRTETQGVVILHSHFDNRIHHILGEDVSLKQELVILLEGLGCTEK